MNNPKWTIGFIFLFVIFTVLSGIVEAEFATGMTKLETLFKISWSIFLPWNAWNYLVNLWEMFSFQYAFLDGMPYSLARYLLFWPISAGLVVSLIVGAIRR